MTSAKVTARTAFTGVRPERIFLVIGAVFGLLFLFVTPPFQAPDEYAHFYRAFQVSEGGLLAQRRDGVPGAWLPTSVLTTGERAAPGIAFHPEKKERIEDLLALIEMPLAPERRSFVGLPNTARYVPLLYLPQAAAIGVGRILGLAPILLTYAGRAGNLATWLCLGYLALKVAPIIRWPMLLLLLMPMSLFEAASLSADAMTNAVSFLLIACCLRIAVGETDAISNREWALLTLLCVMTALSKQVYLPLAALVLWIPARKFGGRRRQIACLAVAGTVTALAWGAWTLLVANMRVEFFPYTSVPDQLAFVRHHPGQFLRIVFATLSSHPSNQLRSFVGILGWLDTPLPNRFIESYCFMLALTVLATGRAEVRVSARQRLLATTLAAACVLALLIVLYAYWTRVGDPVIEGIQGRYFIPLSPLACVVLYNRSCAIESRLWGPIVALYSVLSGLLTVVVLWQRYW
jgi:uncharacterized membrane protein